MIPLKIELPEGFLEEEERFGHHVNRSTKEVWAVELDLLAEFDRVCKKREIAYWAFAGTLLGAIRHGGFIPWDDDIDVCMLRKDYERLCEHADDFSHPYFFQTAYTDKGHLRGHAQLRNSLTTAVLKNELKFHRTFNQGIFIDIFPYDAVEDDEEQFLRRVMRIRRLKQRCKRLSLHCLNYRREAHSLKGKAIHPLVVISGLIEGYMDVYQKMEQELVCLEGEQTRDVSVLSLANYEQRFRVNRLWLSETKYKSFEFLTVPVPAEYDRILTQAYGSYKEPVRDSSAHGGTIFDVDTPYEKWLEDYA